MKLNPVALKEWASVIDVLAEGDQILVMRKGGIEEETRRFELKSRSFYLFPTYEHQRTHLVKDPYRSIVERSLSEYDAGAERVKLTAYAEAVDDLEVRDHEQLELLYPYHMWTGNLAEERLRWKAKEPLHVLLLRVYKLEEPALIKALPEYGGCRSWIELPSLPDDAGLSPVLSEDSFEEQRRRIKSILGQ
ncbi:DUF1802 family protein [Paenibacillus rhizophilus]|uniref:DUF1802 family protein n=1 Tax=Paenibacillus rhizophilus TaxID=1850366 RepID=A0A3N9PAJ8_9BACL|nr:DUF1802 family protein [Paenibacillus rhizophilus]RQW12645.1 DUF1802 family protein [Paenibacillus rhizophilus]